MIHISGVFSLSANSLNKDGKVNDFLKNSFTEKNLIKTSFHPDSKLKIWGVNRKNDPKKFYEDSEIFMIYSGNIFPIQKQYIQYKKDSNIISYIKNTYINYGSKLTEKIKGSFILLIYSKKDNQLLLLNDHFGFLKLYFHLSDNEIIFSTSLDFFKKCGMVEIKINLSSVLQKIIFNYPISNNSYFESVSLLPASTIINYKASKVDIIRYWNPASLMTQPVYNYRNGVEIVHASLDDVINKYISEIKNFGLSLTGGWDGRLILSYLTKKDFKDFFLYSFGTEQSKDIKIPEMICEKEGYNYTPIYLNKEYENSHQSIFSKECILNSDGIRNVNLGHYNYTMSLIGNKTSNILSGNCGSNLLKALNSTGPIYNDYIKMLFETDSLSDSFLKIKQDFSTRFPFFKIDEEIWEKCFHELSLIPTLNISGLNNNQKFYVFLLDTIERMYFGSEVSSYLNYVDNYSPFIDYDFLIELSTTPYFGAHHSFFSKKGYLARYYMSSLYARLINMNSSSLGNYVSDRGFSLNDMVSFFGQVNLVLSKLKSKMQRAGRGHSLSFDYISVFNSFDQQLQNDVLQLLDLDNIGSESLINIRPIQNYKSFLVWNNSL